MTAQEILEQAKELLERREIQAAREAFGLAKERGADSDECAAGLWMAAMFLGHFEEAWRQSDAIRQHGSPDLHRFWNGQTLRHSRLMVRCLHGYGDTVQMLRYASQLKQIASLVTYEFPPRMLPLAPFFAGVESAITWGKEAPVAPPDWNSQVEVMELPYIFRTHLTDLPLEVGYLQFPETLLEPIKKRLNPRRKQIGLVWGAGAWKSDRSIPLSLFQSLLEIPGIDYWSLQRDEDDLSISGIPLRSATEEFGDGLLPLACTIACLDLVITVDTLAAHLAGAMGKPAWLLLQQRADWRWMLDRSDSPWYPSLRLFRQKQEGSWEDVVRSVKELLQTRRAA